MKNWTIIFFFLATLLLLSGCIQPPPEAPIGKPVEPPVSGEPTLEILGKETSKQIYRYGPLSYSFGKMSRDAIGPLLEIGWPTIDITVIRYWSICPDGRKIYEFIEEKLFANLGFIYVRKERVEPTKVDTKPRGKFFAGHSFVIEKDAEGKPKIFSRTENGETIYFIKYKTGKTSIISPKHYNLEGMNIRKPGEEKTTLLKLPAFEDARLEIEAEDGTVDICRLTEP